MTPFYQHLAYAITNAVPNISDLYSIVNPKENEVRYVIDINAFYYFDISDSQWKPSFATIQPQQGVTGVQGRQGTTGVRGPTGVQGATGVQGIQGTTGVQGVTGLGAQGVTGIHGYTGLQGVTGVVSSDVYTRLTNLESLKHYKIQHTVTDNDIEFGYLDLNYLVKDGTMLAAVDRLLIHEGLDYSLETLTDKTRVHFSNFGYESIISGSTLFLFFTGLQAGS